MRRLSTFQISLTWLTALLFLISGTTLSAAIFFSSTTAQAASMAMPLETGITTCSGNLISNPGFESDASGSAPAGWMGAGKVGSESPGFNTPDGTKFAYVTGNKWMWVSVTPTIGKSYEATFYSGSHNPNPTQKVRLTVYNASSTVLAQSVHTITTDMEVLGTFGGPYTLNIGPIPAGATELRFEVTDGGNDYAKIDGVCLHETTTVPTATPTATKTSVPPTATPTKTSVPPTATATSTPTSGACAANLVSNPGFENDMTGTHPAGWSGSGWVGGEYQGFNTQEGVKFAYVTGNQWMWVSIVSTAGKSYEATFYSGSHVPNPTQQVRLTFYDASFNQLAQSVHTIVADMENLGQFGGPYTLTIGPAPAGTSELRFEVTDGGNNYAKIDGVCLHETMTPTATPTTTSVPPTATPTTVTCNGSITALRLWSIDGNRAVAGYDPIANGSTIYLEDLPTNFNLEALTSGSVGSVKFDINGATDFENVTPYRYTSDNEPWHPSVGNYTVTATVYQNGNLGGAICGSKSVNFTIANRPTNTPVPPTATPTNTKVPPTATSTNTPVPPTATPTNTKVPPTATPTNTPVPPTATPTNTKVPPTATPTNTPVPPTATPTNTKVPPTATPTNTPVPPTATPTNTPVPPTATPTNTKVPPTATPTNTPVPPTATPTNTKVPPTATPTNTSVPPTATPTNTKVPPTATPTNTSVPPTATPTNTKVPPTATPTNTSVPPTATPTNTPVPPTATPTNTPVPPTATPTNTPVPPTATPTNTPVPPTATPTNTPVPPTATPTNTPVPPTATPTNTPKLGSLGNQVWYDVNHSANQDNNPTYVPGVRVDLLEGCASGTVLETQFTDNNGYYTFFLLPAGQYRVLFSNLPAGYEFTSKDQGVSDSTDSDANTNGFTDCITLATGEDNPTVDAGIVKLVPTATPTNTPVPPTATPTNTQVPPTATPTNTPLPPTATPTNTPVPPTATPTNTPVAPASLGNYVWLDQNKDGIQDSSEKGVSGIVVELLNSQGTVLVTTTTDADGFYLFANLTPDEYKVHFVHPTKYLPTKANQGSNDETDSDANTSTFQTELTQLVAGENDLSWDYGIFLSEVESPDAQAALGDYVWEDSDRNGIQTAGEKPIANVTVLLYNGQGQVISTTVTDNTGHYWFYHLNPGSYVVEFVPPTGYLLTESQIGDDAFDSDIAADTHRTPLVTLAAGQINPTLDAGFYPVPTSDDNSPELPLSHIFLPLVSR